MAKKKSKTSKEENPKLSKEAIERMEHFFSCHPPKYFNRNLRSLIVDWMDLNNIGEADFQEELLAQLNSFFPVLDFIEDEGKFGSEDYNINRVHKPER